MPGRLVQYPPSSNVIFNKMTDPAGAGSSTLEPSTPLANGNPPISPASAKNTHFPNGLLPVDQAQPASRVKGLAQLVQELPSETPQLERMTDGYQPLSRLFERTARECFNGLNDTINNSQHAPRSSMVNGNVSHLDNQESSQSTAKRLRWLNFANSNRERFLKLLVLLQWSRQSRQDIGQLVDVFAWMRRLSDYYDSMEDELGSFKRDVSTYKVLRPDIQTALETLTTGQSARIPDLGYIPHSPISAQQTLHILQNVNSILHIRLNVHQDLPPHLRNFKIDSGRVTFTITHEFALDLSVYDEDPSSPFYFVDFRFLFSPCSEIPTGQLRSELELRSNAVLASEGLNACYDLLHDFVLTYKLSILRQQALQLSRGAWADALRIDRVHRSLILHYWPQNHQKKSWLEIGVSSGKRDDALRSLWRDEPQTSSLYVKWVRAGEVVKNPDLPTFDADELDVEQLLKQTVKLHIDHLLGSVQDKLTETAAVAASHTPYLTTSDVDDQSSISLVIPLYQNKHCLLKIEPISGKYSISPKTSSSTRCEERLDNLKHPEQELLPRLQVWRAYDGAEMIKSNASRFGWSVVRSIQLDAPTRKQYFGDESGSLTLLQRWRNQEWFLAALPNHRLEFSFWIVQILKAAPTLWSSETSEVRQCRKLPVDVKHLSVQVFTRLYRWSLGTISSQVIRQGLKQLKIPFAPLNLVENLAPAAFPPLWIDLSHHLGFPKMKSHLILCQCGFLANEEGSTVYHVLKGKLDGLSAAKSGSKSIQAPDVSFRSDGNFAIRNGSLVGSTDVVQRLLDKLKHVILLQTCLDTLKRRCFESISATLSSLSFAYAESPKRLQAALEWSEQGSISLTLSPPTNPHIRLFEPLQKLLWPSLTPLSKGTAVAALQFSGFTRALSDSLELMQTFDKIEAQGDVAVQVDSLDKYRMEYSAPKCDIQITYVRTEAEGWWYFQSMKQQIPPSEKLETALGQVMGKSGPGILNLSQGVACNKQAVADFVKQLNESIRACGEPRAEKPREPPKRQSSKPEGVAKKADATNKPAQAGEAGEAMGQASQSFPSQARNINGRASNGVKRHEPDVVVLED